MSNPSLSTHQRSWRLAASTAIGLTAYLLMTGVPTAAQTTGRDVGRDAADVADRFAAALAKGDLAVAKALLQPSVLIFESGEAETSSDEYAHHHLPADIAFMAGMTRSVVSRQVGGEGDIQWVATRARISGQYKGKAVDLDSTETMVVTQTPTGWRISHVHWSSSTHRKRG